MSFVEVKDEIAKLDRSEQDALIAYLVGIRERQSQDFLSELTEMIDDKDRSNWHTLDDLDHKLGPK